MFFIAGGLVFWETKQQKIITISTIEAEYMAFTQATQQVLWFTKFFNEVSLLTATPVIIQPDNSESISNSTNDKNH